MIRLLIACILISLVTGKSYDSYGINLENLKESLQVASQNIESEVTYLDSVIFIGNKNSGKSTLINYLIGNKLKAVKISPFEPLKIIKAENESEGPEMDSGSQSKNTIPTRWSSKKLNDLTLWDAPDMDDNGEELQDIVRSFYFFKLMKNVKSLKIILVINIRDIEDDRKNYLSLLTAMENIFGNHFEEYFSSTSVIFTKVRNTSEIPVDYKYIGYHLEKHFLNDSGLKWSQVSKNFTRFLLANNDRIALLKEMSHDGDVTSEIDFNIFTAIEKSKIIPKSSLQDLRPSISNSLKLRLSYSQEKLQLELSIKEIEIILAEKIEKYIVDANNLAIKSNMIQKMHLELYLIGGILQSSLDSGYSFELKIKSLYPVDVKIRQKIEESRLLQNFQLLTFIESTLNINITKSLESSLYDVVFSSLLKVESLTSMITLKLEVLMEKLNRKYLRNTINEQIQKISLLKKVYVQVMNDSHMSISDFIAQRLQKIF
ncbi:uncharacterized protein LOC122498343 isoform X2 [Leptopilina heterotoma]|uniref:uncharacterized protein LOC122498343 isoform X2 n=1 Tax=Leptopilina heterotoma TaxID=63436 RepID=UPI001CA7F02B|nr:uncharacterized protein LOC122498343 isoform X2 [Leptopilina heterotoma]